MHASTQVEYPATAGSACFTDLRHCTGQVVLGNDIQRHACRFVRQDEDPSDTYLLLIDERIRKLLAQCPGHVLLITVLHLRATDRRGNDISDFDLFWNAWKTSVKAECAVNGKLLDVKKSTSRCWASLRSTSQFTDVDCLCGSLTHNMGRHHMYQLIWVVLRRFLHQKALIPLVVTSHTDMRQIASLGEGSVYDSKIERCCQIQKPRSKGY